jgi:hypothetical protein
MEKFTKENVEILREQIQSALNEIVARHGLVSIAISPKFTVQDNNFVFNIDLLSNDEPQLSNWQNPIRLVESDIVKSLGVIRHKNRLNNVFLAPMQQWTFRYYSWRCKVTLLSIEKYKAKKIAELSTTPDVEQARNILLFSALGMESDLIG